MSAYDQGPAAGPDLVDRLHERGLRVTPQRERVLHAVRRLGHATPEQIFDAVPDVDLTTVYRTLELLEDIGMVRHTHLDHGAPAYRPAEDDHVHVVCHECGTVVDVPSELADELERRLRAERGFTLDRAHLTVFGRCAACAEQTRRARR
ncbi:MAG: Fur family transcriptional regulator [Jatrophihabitantaceae bacterium]